MLFPEQVLRPLRPLELLEAIRYFFLLFLLADELTEVLNLIDLLVQLALLREVQHFIREEVASSYLWELALLVSGQHNDNLIVETRL